MQHNTSSCVGRVSSDSRCASRRRERERLGSPQSTGKVGWGGVGSKFSMRLGSEWAWFALEGKDHASLQKGTRVESRDVWRRDCHKRRSCSLGWLARKQCQQIARMLMKMTCQTAGGCQLGGSWRPTHRTPRMTSCGFEDLAGPGKPHQGLTGTVESPDDPDVRFSRCLMRPATSFPVACALVCLLVLVWRVSWERRRNKVWYRTLEGLTEDFLAGRRRLEKGQLGRVLYQEGNNPSCAQVGTGSAIRPGHPI